MSGQELPGWSARPRPAPIVQVGRFCRLEPLDVAKHGEDLWHAVAGHDDIWTYMAYGPFQARGPFLTWLSSRAGLNDPLYFAVIDHASGRALGCVTLMEIRPESGVIEVGHIFFSPGLQRTPAATEAIYLLAKYVFDLRGYRRLEWKCNDLNEASKRAALRFGFTAEGVMRQHMVVKNRSRDTAWFALLDSDWPLCRHAFDAWLSEANLPGPSSMQRHALADIRTALKQRLARMQG